MEKKNLWVVSYPVFIGMILVIPTMATALFLGFGWFGLDPIYPAVLSILLSNLFVAIYIAKILIEDHREKKKLD